MSVRWPTQQFDNVPRGMRAIAFIKLNELMGGPTTNDYHLLKSQTQAVATHLIRWAASPPRNYLPVEGGKVILTPEEKAAIKDILEKARSHYIQNLSVAGFDVYHPSAFDKDLESEQALFEQFPQLQLDEDPRLQHIGGVFD